MAALLLGLLEEGSVGVGGCADGGACAWLGEAIVMVCGLFFLPFSSLIEGGLVAVEVCFSE